MMHNGFVIAVTYWPLLGCYTPPSSSIQSIATPSPSRTQDIQNSAEDPVWHHTEIQRNETCKLVL